MAEGVWDIRRKSMKAGCVLFALITAGSICLAQAQQAQQPPAGPTLDFTLNYINNALQHGSIALNGTRLTWSYYDTDTQYTSEDTIDLLAVEPTVDLLYGHPTLVCQRQNSCVELKGTGCDSCGLLKGTHFSSSTFMSFNVIGDQFKQSDVAHAFTHMIALVKAQHESEVRQEQQQNQSDPFAKPQ